MVAALHANYRDAKNVVIHMTVQGQSLPLDHVQLRSAIHTSDIQCKTLFCLVYHI